MPTPTLNLLAEVLVHEREVDEVQRSIDHGRKTILGYLSPIRAYLDRKQLAVDVQRIKIEAAKQYLNAQAEIENR